MESSRLPFLSITQAADLLRSKQVSPVELTQAVLNRIGRIDKKINAYITVTGDQALEAARRAEQAMRAGEYLGPLHGIPIALKDNFWTAGTATTAGSKILRDFVPTQDATVVRRLKEAGVVLLGKLNMHEFAWGATTDNPHYGPTRNPWDVERIPAGSSGGSGAALAADLCLGATGSDTGGSIRHPAAVCGIVGFKPTYGRVSLYGIVPLAWSLDHAGPMTKTVKDAALMLQVMAGYDPADPFCADVAVPEYSSTLDQGVRGLRIGVYHDFFFTHIQEGTRVAVEAALKTLGQLGADIVEVELPHIRHAYDTELTILYPESSTYHRDWLRNRPDDYGTDVRTNIEVGEFHLATQYIRAQRVRRLIRDEFVSIFRKVDALVTPTLPITATKIGAMTCVIDGREEDLHGNIIRFTAPFNVIGVPTLSVPCGFSEGLPVGMQVIGKPWDEPSVLRIGHAYQQATDWHTRRPEL
jgi:aspartyl-tRNA(Asn)/glutamyl-tRNA(Gln) amidotransferase subunit A